MSNLGSLVVSLEANIAKYTSDMGKAAAIAEQRMHQIDKSIGLVKTSLAVLGAGFASTLAFDAIKSKIEGVIAAAAELEKLSARTGSTVESLSGLAAVAKLSGTDTDALALGLQKLSKSMVDAENGGKKTTASFEAIGISADSLRGKSPTDVFLLLSKQLDKYQDDAGKTVVAQNLLGKAGANLLPVLKDLAIAGDYVTKTTSEQARAAKEFEDNVTRLKAASDAVYKIIGLALVPTLSDLTLALLDAQKGTHGLKSAASALVADHSIRDWAQDAAIGISVVIETVIGLGKAVYAVVGSVQVVLADIRAKNAQATQELENAGAKIGAAKVITAAADETSKALEARNKMVAEANKRYADLLNFDSRSIEKNIKARFAGTNAMSDLAQNSDARDMKIRKAAEDAAKKPAINTSRLGNANLPKGPADDPAKKKLEGDLKAQESYIAAEKAQLQTREQYLQYYYRLEYLNADQYYTSKTALIQDALKAELEAYAKEEAAVAVYLAQADKLVEQQDAKNKQAEIEVKRVAAEVEASKQQVAVTQERDAIYRQFALTTIEVARQAKLSNTEARFQIDLLGKGTLEILKATEAKRIQLAVDERIRQLRKDGGPQSLIEIAIATADAEAQKAAAIDLVTESYEKQRTIAFGASEAFRKYAEDATNTGTQIEGAMTDAFKGMEDAMVNFVTTGKLSFTSLADSIVANITRIIVKQQIMIPLENSLKSGMDSGTGVGGAIGGFFDKLFGGGMSSGSAPAFSLLGSPSYAIGTDFVPHDMVAQIHKGERIIPAAQNRPGAMGNTVNVTVNQSFPIGTTRTTTLQAAADARRQLEFAGRNL